MFKPKIDWLAVDWRKTSLALSKELGCGLNTANVHRRTVGHAPSEQHRGRVYDENKLTKDAEDIRKRLSEFFRDHPPRRGGSNGPCEWGMNTASKASGIKSASLLGRWINLKGERPTQSQVDALFKWLEAIQKHQPWRDSP